MKKLGLFVAAALGLGQQGASQERPVTQRIPQFENDAVKVWKSIIQPGQPLSMHRHERSRVIVALVGGSLKIVEAAGDARVADWETGKAYWLTADPPGTTHADVNETGKAIEVMVIEVKSTSPAAPNGRPADAP